MNSTSYAQTPLHPKLDAGCPESTTSISSNGLIRSLSAEARTFCDSGWRPVSSLDDGLRETLEGFRQRAREASASIWSA